MAETSVGIDWVESRWLEFLKQKFELKSKAAVLKKVRKAVKNHLNDEDLRQW
ncbi:MAG: hypothetical protein IH845_05370 [Nanoarchaeota archaeon]|nr:hypothetical protein [Nanoarchaeota archaeon]